MVATRIAVGYKFTPFTINRIEQLAQYYEISRTALIERIVKEFYESLIQRSQFPPVEEGVGVADSVK